MHNIIATAFAFAVLCGFCISEMCDGVDGTPRDRSHVRPIIPYDNPAR